MSDPDLHSPLLAPDEPEPFDTISDDGQSPYFFVCDHAGRLIPRALGTLGLSESELRAHVAWDIGAEGVARRAAQNLGAFLIVQRYSRLVIDCNRPLDAPDSISTLSERTMIPGNQNLPPEQAALRARTVYHPYHERIRDELARRERAGRQTILVTMHSFTPVFHGVARPWHVGVLYNRDARLAHALRDLLRRETSWVVGDNEPYRVTDRSDVAVVEYGERRGNLHVELEVRQDLIENDAGQRQWADELSALLRKAAVALR